MKTEENGKIIEKMEDAISDNNSSVYLFKRVMA